MTSTILHQKSVKSGLRPPCFNRDLVVVGMRNAVYKELTCIPPRYDAKPARFALNQGSRKICSGGVTCPGLIRCVGLEQLHLIWKVHAEFSFRPNIYCLIWIHDISSAVINTIKAKNKPFKALDTNSKVHWKWFSRLIKNDYFGLFLLFQKWDPKNSLTAICRAT